MNPGTNASKQLPHTPASALDSPRADPVASAPPPASDVPARWCGVSIAVAILIAVTLSIIRGHAQTVDFWFDDSYVVMSTRVPLSSVRLVALSAPGFTVLVRWWVGLHSGSISWAQWFGVFGLVASPIVVFFAARTAGAARWAATTTACLTALAPMLLTESARVKPYTLEFALSAAMVGIAAAIRRDGPAMRWTVAAGVLVLAAALFSGALLLSGVVLYAIMVLSVSSAVRQRSQPLSVSEAARRLSVPAVTSVLVVAWSAAFLLHPSAPLSATWRGYGGFLGSTGSPGHTVRQAISIGRGFFGAFIAGGATPLIIIPVLALAWFVACRWRTAWWLFLAPALAVILSVTQLYPLGPLGKARIEAWMMPWIAVLVALTFTELGSLPSVRSLVARVPRMLGAAAVAVLALALVAGAAKATVVYPATRAREALRTIAAYKNNGFAYVANHDFPIELVAPGPIRVVKNARSTTNYRRRAEQRIPPHPRQRPGPRGGRAGSSLREHRRDRRRRSRDAFRGVPAHAVPRSHGTREPPPHDRGA